MKWQFWVKSVQSVYIGFKLRIISIVGENFGKYRFLSKLCKMSIEGKKCWPVFFTKNNKLFVLLPFSYGEFFCQPAIKRGDYSKQWGMMVLVFSSSSSSAQELNFHVSFFALGHRTRKLDWIMYLKYSIFIKNHLIIINFSSTIDHTIFKPVSFDPSFQDEDFDVSYVSLASKVR